MDLSIITLGQAVLFGAMFTIIFTKAALPSLKAMKARQSILEDAPESHKKKAGTPTMGGLSIILALLLSVLMIMNKPVELFVLFAVTLAFGLIGFLDDYIKVVKKRNLGLKAWQKSALQVVVSGALAVYQYTVNSKIFIPFAKTYVDLGWFIIPFIILVGVGTTNAVNLTDGLDGLASSVSAVAAGFFCAVCYTLEKPSESVYSAMLVGACLGFLFYNWHPAKLFMGDTGSLAIGGAFTAIAVLSGLELLLILIGGVFVWEALSVIIQVAYFKATGGKRVFRMSPFHHHLELGGMKETTVVALFCIAGVLLGVIAIAGV